MLELNIENLKILIKHNLIAMIKIKYKKTRYDFFKGPPYNTKNMDKQLDIVMMIESPYRNNQKDVMDNFSTNEILISLKSFFKEKLDKKTILSLFKECELSILETESNYMTKYGDTIFRKAKVIQIPIEKICDVLLNHELKNIVEYETIFSYIDFDKDEYSKSLLMTALLNETLTTNEVIINKPKL